MRNLYQKSELNKLRRTSRSYNEEEFRAMGIGNDNIIKKSSSKEFNPIPKEKLISKNKRYTLDKENKTHFNSPTKLKNLFNDINLEKSNNLNQEKTKLNSNGSDNRDSINNNTVSINSDSQKQIRKFSKENSFEKEKDKKIIISEESRNILEKIYYIKSKKNDPKINDIDNCISIFKSLIEFSNNKFNTSDLKEIQKILYGYLDEIKNNFHFDPVIKLFEKNIDLIIQCKDFDIFNFEELVGQENSLPVVSICIMDHLDLFNLVNKKHFENFIYEISRGYIKENYYHNDRHAGDVAHTSFTYLTLGKVKEVIIIF